MSERPANKYFWWSTAPNPDRDYGPDQGQQGFRLHAVASPTSSPYDIKSYTPSLCGLTPTRGWGVDLFVDQPCTRCVRSALKHGVWLPSDILDHAILMSLGSPPVRGWEGMAIRLLAYRNGEGADYSRALTQENSQ